jgi:hypothetical protein
MMYAEATDGHCASLYNSFGFPAMAAGNGLAAPEGYEIRRTRFTDAAINAIYKQEAGLKVNSRFGGGGTTAAAGASTHFF